MMTLFKTLEPLILASNSPRRKTFLKDAGLEFSIQVEEIDEVIDSGESADTFVARMAKQKGEKISEQYKDHWVVSADTIVVDRNGVLGKPTDESHAVSMLLCLSGNTHNVKTAFCLSNWHSDVSYCEVVDTEVTFTNFSEDFARSYVATGEPMDKAGAYGIQNLGGMFVKKINGSYSNVVGLPMAELMATLIKYNVISDR